MTAQARWATIVVVALLAILGTGLLAGRLLERYDETIGFDREAERIAEVLRLRPGMNVADVRAGTGKWAAHMARKVGPNGQVYATAGPNPAHEIYETLAAARVDNVNVIIRTPGEQSRVPPDCCEAVLVRAVYHEFDDRLRVMRNVYRALKPGGRMAVIDFDEGTPEQLSGHGIAKETAIAEITSVGFELVEVIDDWEGNAYCLVFRRPEEPAEPRTGSTGP